VVTLKAYKNKHQKLRELLVSRPSVNLWPAHGPKPLKLVQVHVQAMQCPLGEWRDLWKAWAHDLVMESKHWISNVGFWISQFSKASPLSKTAGSSSGACTGLAMSVGRVARFMESLGARSGHGIQTLDIQRWFLDQPIFQGQPIVQNC
jgi:hypothetical protein